MAVQQAATQDTGKTTGLQGQFSQQNDDTRRLSALKSRAETNWELPRPLRGFDDVHRAYTDPTNLQDQRTLVMATLDMAEAMFNHEAIANRGTIHRRRHVLAIVDNDQDALLMTRRLKKSGPGLIAIKYAADKREAKWIDAAAIERRADDKPAPITGVQLALPLH